MYIAASHRPNAYLIMYSRLEPGRSVVRSQSLIACIFSKGLAILLLSLSMICEAARYFEDIQLTSTRSEAQSSSCRASK